MSHSMPILFVGHGSPTNAIEVNEFSRTWADVGKALPKPKAILSISAHWETPGTFVTAMPKPATLYDFYGFPQPLYEKHYPAPGAPELARSIQQEIGEPKIGLNTNWGLDHGTWSVLSWMFPAADIPVLQLSLDFDQPPHYHYELGQKLTFLRSQSVLVLGSGNMVHNLRAVQWDDVAFDWAGRFDDQLREHITQRNHQALIDYPAMENARLAIPTNEHYLPLLYILAMQKDGEAVSFFCDKVTLGSISMRSLRIG